MPAAVTLLNALECAGKIQSLIANARREVWLISPYFDLEGIDNLSRTVAATNRPGRTLSLVVRDEPEILERVEWQTEDWRGPSVSIFCVPRLHAKVYWSDEEAIVTSLNLTASSMAASIEIGLALRPGDVHAAVRRFIRSDIEPHMRELWPNAASGREGFSGKAAYCVGCGRPQPLDPDRPYCRDCWSRLPVAGERDAPTRYCLSCGREYRGSMSRPQCTACYFGQDF